MLNYKSEDWKEIRPRLPIGIKISEEEFQILKSYFGHVPTLWELQEITNQAWHDKIEKIKKSEPFN